MRQDCMTRALTREIIVGTFLVMVFLGLAYFTIILSRENWFRPRTAMEVIFKDVMGLSDGDSVVVRGMPVGKVKRLELKKDGVHVHLALDQPLNLRTDYRITVVATSILGGRMLQIHEGSPDRPHLPSDAALFGQQPYDMMADAAELVHEVKRGLVEGGAISNLQATTQQLRQIADRLAAGEGTLGRLLSSDDQLYRDFSSAVASLKIVAERIEKGEGVLGKLLSSDDQLYRDLSAAVASLKTVAERIEKGEGALGKLLSSDDRLVEDLTAAAASIRNITDGLERGQGMIGRLLQDDSLYLELEETIVELRATIDDFRETAPLTTFSSVFFGAF